MTVVITPKSATGTPDTGEALHVHAGVAVRYPDVPIGNATFWRVPTYTETQLASATYLWGNASASSVVRYTVDLESQDANADVTIELHKDGALRWQTVCRGASGFWAAGGGGHTYNDCRQKTATVDLSGAARSGEWAITVRGGNGKRVRARVEIDTN